MIELIAAAIVLICLAIGARAIVKAEPGDDLTWHAHEEEPRR